MKSRYAAFIFALVPVLGLAIIVRNIHNDTVMAENIKKSSEKKTQQAPKPDAGLKNEIIEENSNETGIVIGNMFAKNELVLMSSLSCKTCKAFHEQVLPKIKQIPNLRIRLEFYIDTKPSLAAVKMINLPNVTNEMKIKFIKACFKNQAKLEGENSLNFVYKLAKDFGINSQSIDAAKKDEQLAKRIVGNFKQVSSSIKSEYLPAFTINGHTYKKEISLVDGKRIPQTEDIIKFIKNHCPDSN